MNTHVTRGPKRWLFCAATGLMLIQPEVVLAQVQTAGSTAQAPSSAKHGNPAAILKNAVQREFHGFYDRSAAPRTTPAAASPTAPRAARPNPRPAEITTAAATTEPPRILQVANSDRLKIDRSEFQSLLDSVRRLDRLWREGSLLHPDFVSPPLD